MDIQIDDPARPDVHELLEEHLRSMHELSPPESVHALDPGQLGVPGITFWTVREDGVLLGCGALKELSPEHGEIKSMRTPLSRRRRGAGRAVLEHIVREAHSRGYRRLSLETGSTAAFVPARTLYERFGFASCGPFGDYRPDPHSVFMTLELEHIVGPALQREREIEAILRTLPGWFGIEQSLREYAADSARMPTFAAEVGGELVGFITLARHFPQAWEVHCMAVSAARRNTGIGSRLLEHAEHFVRAEGGRFLQVKTVADLSPSPAYAQTRLFYLARGFAPLEVFPTLWDARNPVLQLVKSLEWE